MRRYSIHGHQLTAKTFETACGDCGMPTISADEFHPYKACEVYKLTHDSRIVEQAIEPLFREHVENLSRAEVSQAKATE